MKMHSSEVFHNTLNYSLPHKTNFETYLYSPEASGDDTQGLVGSTATKPHISGIDNRGEGKENSFAHTEDHRQCPACEKARIVTMQPSSALQLMTFENAFDIWLELHKEEIKSRTYKDYLFYSKRLKEFFGPMKLSQIHIGNILEYRKQRGAGVEIVNHECCALKQVMEMAGLWDLIEKYYKPLKRPQWSPPKVLTADEEEKFFRVVANKKDWEVAYWAVSLSNNTGAIGSELRFLQLRHVFLDWKPPKIHVPDDKVKNEFRARVIPLNDVAFKQAQRLLERAVGLGAKKPEHHIFPFRVKKGEYDVTRPASPWFIRSAFRSMRAVLGPEFSWLNPRNFRNQLITKLFESGAPDETITSIAGHQAIKMSKYYSRIRLDAKYDALKKIAPKSTGNGASGRETA